MDRLAYSINETAALLSVGRTSVYAMLADQRLHSFTLGRRRLVKAESIKRLLDAQG